MAKKTFTCGSNSRDPVQAEDYIMARHLLGCSTDCPNTICRGPKSPQDRRDDRQKVKDARR